jgi:hypothetical protein
MTEALDTLALLAATFLAALSGVMTGKALVAGTFEARDIIRAFAHRGRHRQR